MDEGGFCEFTVIDPATGEEYSWAAEDFPNSFVVRSFFCCRDVVMFTHTPLYLSDDAPGRSDPRIIIVIKAYPGDRP